MKSRLLLFAFTAILSLIPTIRTTAQTFNLLHTFTGESGAGRSIAGLTLADGKLYGAAAEGGFSDPTGGAIFSINPDGSEYTILYSFDSTNVAAPVGTLTLNGDTLYGTTLYGSNYTYDGTIFKVTTNGTGFSILHRFNGADGSSLGQPLIFSGDVLYGTTSLGGSSNNGTIFKLNSDGTDFTTLHFFAGGNSGANPMVQLVLSGDALYGSTSGGGISNYGTIFRISTNGTDFTTVHHFVGGSGGANPRGGFILLDETLYGNTEYGDNFPGGIIFSVKTNGAEFTTIHNFFRSTNEGSHPIGLLLSGSTLYGTTEAGIFVDDEQTRGTVSEINTNGSGYKLLYNFSQWVGPSPFAKNTDGSNPSDIILSAGVLYGTTIFGGNAGYGTVFSVSLPGPALGIFSSEGNIILTWPTNAPGFTLQSTTNLTSPVAWSSNSPAPAIVNGQNTVTNLVSDTQQFYRLGK